MAFEFDASTAAPLGESAGFDPATAKPVKPQGTIAYLASQAKAGLTADLPTIAGKALQYAGATDIGSRIRAVGEANAASAQPEEDRAAVTRFTAGALRGAAPIVPLALAQLTPAGPALDVAGAGALAAGFGGAQAQDTFEKAKAAGLSDEAATSAARKTGAITGVGMGAVGMLAGGLAAPAIRAVAGTGAKTAAESLAAEAAPSFVRPFVADSAGHLVGNAASMAAANAGTAAVEQQAGLPGPTPGQAALEGLESGAGLTAALLPFGAARTVIAKRANAAAVARLQSADTDPGHRAQVAAQIHANLNAIDPEAANHFANNVGQAIDNKQPLELGAHLLGPIETQPQPAAPLALPAPVVRVDEQGNARMDGQPPPVQDEAAAAVQGRVPITLPGDSDITDVEPRTPSQAMGIDPNAGPISRAAAIAVDSGAHDHAVAQAAADEAAAKAPKAKGDVTDVQPKPVEQALKASDEKTAIPTAPEAATADAGATPIPAVSTAEDAQGRGRDVEAAGGRGEPAAAVDGANKDGLSGFLGRVLKRHVMEAQGQDILDGMEERGESPGAVADKFWTETYFKLPPAAQERFKRMAANHGGDSILTEKDKPSYVLDMPSKVEHLEGTERGFVALMKEGNDRYAQPDAATKALTAEGTTSGPRPEQTAPALAGVAAKSGEPLDRPGAPAVRTEPASEGAGGPAAASDQGKKPLSVGRMPNDTEPVSVKDGIVHIGKEPALNFDTGEPVKVKDSASDADIRQALKDAGSLSRKQKFFGGEPEVPDNKMPVGRPPEVVRYGVDGVALHEGGQPFTNRMAAGKFQKENQPQARVVKVDGGFALRDATDKETTARQQAGNRLQADARAKSREANPMLAFLAEHGLYHEDGKRNSQKAEFSPDKNINVRGFGNVFRADGMQPDKLAARAAQEGFLKPGSENVGELSKLIQRAISGERIIPQYAEGAAEAEHARQLTEHRELSDLHPADLEESGYERVDAELQARVRELIAAAEHSGIDHEGILGDVARRTQNASQDEYHAAARKALEDALAEQGSARAPDRGGPAGAQASQSQGEAGKSEGLTVSFDGKTFAVASVEDAQAKWNQFRAQASREGGGVRDVGNGVLVKRGSETLGRISYNGKFHAEPKEALTAPTREQVLAQQERKGNAPALDAKQQIDREAADQTLTPSTAPDQRKDNTGDMFARDKAQAELDKRNAGKPKDDSGTAPLFRQGTTEGAPLRTSDIRKAIAPALDRLKVPFELHSSVEDARASAGLKDIPEGVKGMYFGGKLHLIGEGIKSSLEAEETMWHEVNHAGIDTIYGSSKNTRDYYNAMRGLALQNANIREAAKAWLKNFGADDTKARIATGMTRDAAELRTKLQAVEEALSELAGRNAKINGAARFLAKVQQFMRAVGLNRLADSLEKMTDAQALAMIYKAREAVMKEPQREAAGQLQPAFSKDNASFSRTLDKAAETLARIKGAGVAKEVGTAYDGILLATNPAARSDAAKEMARTLIAGMGEKELRSIRFRSELNKAIVDSTKATTLSGKARDLLEKGLTVQADKVFLRATPEENHAFMQAMDTGDAKYFEAHPQLKPLADVINRMFDEKASAIQKLGTGALQNLRENYFPHIWNREPSGDAQREIFSTLAKRPLEGRKGFTKERVFDDVRAGLDAGFEPVSNNPLDIVALKMEEMDKYILAHQTLRAMEGSNGVHLIAAGEKTPQGFTDVNGRFGSIERNGEKLRYVARDDVAQVINNYLSPSLYHNKYVGKPFTAYMGAANTLNQFQLGVFSAFHAGFTSMEAVISHASIGVKALTAGDLKGAAKYLASAPTAWINNPKMGGKIIEHMLDSAAHPEMAPILDGLQMAGFKWQMDNRFRTDATKNMLAAWQDGRKFKAGLNSIGAVAEQTARPILEWLVPRQKFGVFGEMYSKWMQDNPNATHEELRSSAQQIWNRVDSRLGQVVYDRLFVHNVAKNFAQMLIRAPGWTGGTILEVGGGIKDLAGYMKSIASGKRPDSISDRAAYTLSMLMVTAVANATLTALFTGAAPDDWKDLVAFRTGNLDEHGRPERFMLPTYMKDVYAYAKAPGTTLMNKSHPLLSLVGDIGRNRDFYGTEIRSEDDNLLTQLAQTAGFTAKAFVPFWVKGVQKENEREGSALATAAPLFGVMPAPSDLNKTPAEKLMTTYSADRVPQGARTQQEAEKADLHRQMYLALRKGEQDKAKEIFDQGKTAGLFGARDYLKTVRQARQDPLVSNFSHLTYEQAERVMRVANEDEKRELAPAFMKKRIAFQRQHVGQGAEQPGN